MKVLLEIGSLENFSEDQLRVISRIKVVLREHDLMVCEKPDLKKFSLKEFLKEVDDGKITFNSDGSRNHFRRL